MEIVKLRQLKRSQALHLPEAFFIPGCEARIYREGHRVILEPVVTSWDEILQALDTFSKDEAGNHGKKY